MGDVMKKAQYFITCGELGMGNTVNELKPENVRRILTQKKPDKRLANIDQMALVFPE